MYVTNKIWFDLICLLSVLWRSSSDPWRARDVSIPGPHLQEVLSFSPGFETGPTVAPSSWMAVWLAFTSASTWVGETGHIVHFPHVAVLSWHLLVCVQHCDLGISVYLLPHWRILLSCRGWSHQSHYDQICFSWCHLRFWWIFHWDLGKVCGATLHQLLVLADLKCLRGSSAATSVTLTNLDTCSATRGAAGSVQLLTMSLVSVVVFSVGVVSLSLVVNSYSRCSCKWSRQDTPSSSNFSSFSPLI